MPFPPNLFLIGAQKAGTTYLATLLGQHPDICLADCKEPHFFTQHWEKGEAWYRERFPQPERRFLLDASTSYSAAPLPQEHPPGAPPSRMGSVPERIAAMAPGARFIYLMRDPVKRTYSAYWHAVRAGDETRPFAEVIRSGGYGLRMGCYHHQLQHYLPHFDRSRFLLLYFEDFIKEPAHTVNRCLDWLGVAPITDLELSEGKNETYSYGPALRRVDQCLAPVGGLKKLGEYARRIIPYAVLRSARRALSRPVPQMAAEDREWLANYFFEPNQLLVSDFDLPKPDWTRPTTSS